MRIDNISAASEYIFEKFAILIYPSHQNCSRLTLTSYSNRNSSFLDMGPIFEQYGKNKITFRWPNLAQDTFYKLYINTRRNRTPDLDLYWSHMHKKVQNSYILCQVGVAAGNF